MSERTQNNDDESSNLAFFVLLGFIVLGAVAWAVWTVQYAGGIDPERAKELAEEADKECVLAGVEPRACKELVGRHHRECLSEATGRSEKNGQLEVAREAYMACVDRFVQAKLGGEADGER